MDPTVNQERMNDAIAPQQRARFFRSNALLAILIRMIQHQHIAMNVDSILPDLQAAILCEDVRAEISGQQTLIGVIGAVPAPTLPIGFFKLCLWTRWCGGSGDFIQKCLIYDPEEDQAIARAEVPFSLTDLNAHATNVHFFGGVQFQKYGTYHVEILLDEQIRLRIPLPVIQVEAQGTHLAE